MRLVLDSLDPVPAEFRDKATQQDGKYLVEVPDERAVDIVAPGLKRNHDSLLAEKKQVEARLKQIEEQTQGIDLGKAREALAAQSKLEEQRAIQAGEFDKLKQQMGERHATELKTRDETIGSLESEIFSLVGENAAVQAIEGKVVDGGLAVLKPHVMQSVRVVKDPSTGKRKPVVVGEDGKTPRVVDGQGTPMTIEQLVDELLQKPGFSYLAKGPGSSGAGHQPSPGGGSPIRSRKDLLTDADKAAFIGKYGLKAFEELPAG